MSGRLFRAKIQQIKHLTQDIREMTLEMLEPSELIFRPGQAIAVTVPDTGSDSSFLRYFSLASPPHSSRQLILLLNSQDMGKGSTFLLENELGAELQVSGPHGSFILQQEPERSLLFIGTGTGIAPLWSMMETLLSEPCSQSMTLFWGLRSESDRYYVQELEAWKSQYKNFSYVVTLSQPSSAWKGEKGRVTDLLQDLQTVQDSSAYVCGNRAMVKEVSDLLKRKGARAIYRERHSENA